jgi:hypothetical protein
MVNDQGEPHAGDGAHRPAAQDLDVRVAAADEHELVAQRARGLHASSLTCPATFESPTRQGVHIVQ